MLGTHCTILFYPSGAENRYDTQSWVDDMSDRYNLEGNNKQYLVSSHGRTTHVFALC